MKISVSSKGHFPWNYRVLESYAVGEIFDFILHLFRLRFPCFFFVAIKSFFLAFINSFW